MGSISPYVLCYILFSMYLAAWFVPSGWVEVNIASADVFTTDIPSRRDIMVKEVEAIFTMHLDGWNMREDHPRRGKVQQYAEWLTDIIIRYQTDKELQLKGFYLPMDRSTHLILATKVTFESGLNSRKVGKLGEVGLLQVHYHKALKGHSRRQIRNNAKLGLELGVRWFACMVDSTIHWDNKELLNPDYIWEDRNWLCPITLYCHGDKYFNDREGECTKIIGVAKRRLEKMQEYRRRIDQHHD